MGEELLHHADGSAQIYVNLSRDLFERVAHRELYVSHDPGIVHNYIERREFARTRSCSFAMSAGQLTSQQIAQTPDRSRSAAASFASSRPVTMI